MVFVGAAGWCWLVLVALCFVALCFVALYFVALYFVASLFPWVELASVLASTIQPAL